MEKIRVWHDAEWTCLLVDSGVAKATISLTRLEAALLREKLVPPEAVKPWDSHGDGGESERLMGLSAGHVVTEQDVLDLENLLADWNDEIGNSADIFHDGRLAAMREIGGEELLTVVVALDKAQTDQMVARAMVQLKAKLAERTQRIEAQSGETIP